MKKMFITGLTLMSTTSLAFANGDSTPVKHSSPVQARHAQTAPQPVFIPGVPCVPCAECPPPPPPCQSCNYKSNFSGWYVGGQVGLGMTNTNDKFIVNDGSNGHSTLYNRGLLGGLHAGWGNQFLNNIYAGLELYTNMYNNHVKELSLGDIVSTVTRYNSFGLAPRIGYAHNSSLLYLRLGLETTRWKHEEVSFNSNSFVIHKKRLFGLVPGVGLAQMITDEFTLGLEGSFGFFKKVHLHNFFENQTTFDNDTFSNKSFDIAFRLSYMFGDQKVKQVDLLPDSAFTGLFLGGQAGFAYTLTDFPSISVLNSAKTFDRHGTQGAIGGLHLGYGYQFKNRLYLGLEGTADLLSNEVTELRGDGAFYKFKITNSYAVNPRIGYVTRGCGLIYAKIGVEFTRWKHSIGFPNDNIFYSKTKYEPGIAPGLGFAFLVTPNIIAGLEGSYIVYSHEPKVRNLDNANFDYHDRAANLVAKISYKF